MSDDDSRASAQKFAMMLAGQTAEQRDMGLIWFGQSMRDAHPPEETTPLAGELLERYIETMTRLIREELARIDATGGSKGGRG